ncbi:MAG: hypothetical protein IJ489_03780 [Clostridia bacterium]|nr:hypothetical protein [Clostridia bacterium]
MTRNRLMRILLILMSILILIGIVLMRCTPNRLTANGGIIKVLLSDRKTQIIEFEELCLIPGEECEYLVKLENTSAEQCNVTLNFREIEEKTLKNFVRVKMISDGELLCDELLADMFEHENIVLPVDFTKNKNTELKIVYFMPLETGNEAKNTETVFELRITAN